MLEAKYAQAGSFSGGYAPVKDVTTGLWGYINASGTTKIDFQFDTAEAFSEDVAVVTQNGKTYAVNPEGETILLY